MDSYESKARQLAKLRIEYRKLMMTKIFSETQPAREFFVPRNNNQTEKLIQNLISIEQFFSEKEFMNFEHPLREPNIKLKTRTSFLILQPHNYEQRINKLTSFMEKVKVRYPNKKEKPDFICNFLRKQETGVKRLLK